ncbi:Do family serine endopeptidase [Thalassoglobus sp.]|uniref:Do family serine endopeptidase n=1 Tax=Thalassoglobus sp. TaxID=2795869 RepID=UPI003AA8BCB4
MSTVKNKILVLCAITVGICLGVAGIGVSQQATVSKLAPPVTHSPSDLSLAFREVSEKVLPAVVSISTETQARQLDQAGTFQSPEEEMFRRFFGDDERFKEMFKQPRQIPKRMGAGSGFIVNASGIILTNSHVVEGADRVTVRLSDGREIEAESWNFDPRSDVAVVRIDVDEELPFVALGESEAMHIGDWVLALGNPLNVGTTVTAGIISATQRAPGINEREDYIQTDAAINPGNSGGPLVNLHGEVIGINTAISSRSGGYDGIGFAIPSTMVRWVADQLIESGVVKRSYLGVQLQQISNDLREQLQVPFGQGALISDVGSNSPASKAGLQPGDIVMEFNGKKISNRDDLVDVVEKSKPGKSYQAEILRDGKRVKLNVRLEQMPSDYTPALKRGLKSSPSKADPDNVAMDSLGIEVVELNAEISQQLGLDESDSGIVVRSVKPGSPAEQAGLSVGDVIQRVGTRPVDSIKGFGAAIENLTLSKGIVLHVKRNGGAAFVVLKSVN